MYSGKIIRDDFKISQYHITEGATIFTAPGLDGGGEINKGKIQDVFLEAFRKGTKGFDRVIDG